MKPKNKALTEQDLYLQTGDQKHLVQFYNHLIALGWTIQEKEEMVNKNPEVVVDIANGVILRLMETRQPVVKSAPSAYMKTALFYQNKEQFHDSLDEWEEVPVMDEEADSYDEYIESIVSALSLSMNKEEDALVKATLQARLDWHLVYRNLENKQLRREFRKKMNEVKQYAKDNMQSNGVLSVGRTTQQILH